MSKQSEKYGLGRRIVHQPTRVLAALLSVGAMGCEVPAVPALARSDARVHVINPSKEKNTNNQARRLMVQLSERVIALYDEAKAGKEPGDSTSVTPVTPVSRSHTELFFVYVNGNRSQVKGSNGDYEFELQMQVGSDHHKPRARNTENLFMIEGGSRTGEYPFGVENMNLGKYSSTAVEFEGQYVINNGNTESLVGGVTQPGKHNHLSSTDLVRIGDQMNGIIDAAETHASVQLLTPPIPPYRNIANPW